MERADKPAVAPPCGILVVDKPEGISSFGVVAAVRRRAGRAKTGHAGTLDPLATGVLVLAVGRATKSISRLLRSAARSCRRRRRSAR
jgi:tRNA pseudouridine(55) synthase